MCRKLSIKINKCKNNRFGRKTPIQKNKKMQDNILNGYKIIKLLGKGGMADVWYAENNLGKPASIKIMHQKYIGEAAVIARFEAEAKAINKLNHPNIRNVIDYGTYENRPFIVLEYLEGQDLSSYLKNNPKIETTVIASWWNTCIEALHYTHSQHIIHRDLKPSNLFLTLNGDIKIVDFGIAKLRDDFMITTTGQGIGTLAYMSPEQIKNAKEVSCETDYYSLGIAFLKIISNKLPFADTSSEFELMKQIVEGTIHMKGISEEWTYIIKNATHPIPENRKLIPFLQEELTQLNTNPINPTKDIEDSKEITLEDTQVDIETKKKLPTLKKKNKKFIFVLISIFIIFLISILVWKLKGKNYADNELFRAQKNGYFGFSDGKGNEIIPCIYDDVSNDFSEGFAAVYKDGKWGFIDKNGNEIIPLIYDDVREFSEGFAPVYKDGKWGFVDKNGKEVIPCIYDTGFGFYEEGLAKVEKNNKWGYIDKNGKEVIPCIYEDVGWFSEGLVNVKKNGKWGLIEKSGKEVIPLIYDEGFGFYEEDLAKVKKNGKEGYIDKTGKEVIPLIYDEVYEFYEGLAQVKKDGKWGYINKEGKEVIPLIYGYVHWFSEGLAAVWKNHKCGFVDKTGKEVIPCIYENIEDQGFSEGLAAVALGVNTEWKYGYINKGGVVVIPMIYDHAWGFYEGLAAVSNKHKFGFIDKNGKEVIPLIYDGVVGWGFNEAGFARVEKDGKRFSINKKGECVADCP
jgi:serine/threonine protein kinase